MVYVARNVSLDWTTCDFFDQASTEVLEEDVERFVEFEALFNGNLADYGLILSEELVVQLKLPKLLMREERRLVAKDLLFLDLAEVILSLSRVFTSIQDVVNTLRGSGALAVPLQDVLVYGFDASAVLIFLLAHDAIVTVHLGKLFLLQPLKDVVHVHAGGLT